MLFSHYSWGFETTIIRLTNCGMYYGEGACDKCFPVTLDSKSMDRLDWRNSCILTSKSDFRTRRRIYHLPATYEIPTVISSADGDCRLIAGRGNRHCA